MPQIKLPQYDLFGGRTLAERQPDVPDFTVLGAAFGQYNDLVNLWQLGREQAIVTRQREAAIQQSQLEAGIDQGLYRPGSPQWNAALAMLQEPEFDVLEYGKGDPRLEQWYDDVKHVRSAEQYEFRMQQLQREANMVADEAQRSGLTRFGAAVLATLASPVTLAPVGPAISSARSGAGVARVAAGTGAASAALATGQEALLQASPNHVSTFESVMGVGMAGLLGAGIGGAIGAVYLKHGLKAMDTTTPMRTHREPEYPQTTEPTPEDTVPSVRPDTPPLRSAGLDPKSSLGALGRISPVVRQSNNAYSPTARSAMSELDNAGLLHVDEAGDVTSANEIGDVVSRTKGWYGRQALAAREKNTLFNEYQKAGGELSSPEFKVQVTRALRKPDGEFDSRIKEAAAPYRKHLFDPAYKEMTELGIISAKDAPDPGTYAPIAIDAQKVRTDYDGFMEILEEHFARQITERLTKARQQKENGGSGCEG